jgi:hypothetical protein
MRTNGIGYWDERAVAAVRSSHQFASSQSLHSLPDIYASFFPAQLPCNLKMESAGSCETLVPNYQISSDHKLLFAVSAPHYAHSFTPLPLRTTRITAYKKSSNMTFILNNNKPPPPFDSWKMDVQM